jgi:hypothetical protein
MSLRRRGKSSEIKKCSGQYLMDEGGLFELRSQEPIVTPACCICLSRLRYIFLYFINHQPCGIVFTAPSQPDHTWPNGVRSPEKRVIGTVRSRLQKGALVF